MISLVITTYNRFETFLQKNIDKYLTNPYLSEIVIMDDCSSDYAKLVAAYSHISKIKILSQAVNQGALRNKIMACGHASGPWICLMDSDNFADVDYFVALYEEWSKHPPCESCVYAPTQAGKLNYNHLAGKTITTSNWNEIQRQEEPFVNTGNYVFHISILRYLTPILTMNTSTVYAMDVKFMNYFLIKNGIKILAVENMRYDHVVHPGSFYINTDRLSSMFNERFNWKL
jgi:glycosyltransferase involved in cell wall biosynthesis